MSFQLPWLPIKEDVPSVTDVKVKLKAANFSESTKGISFKKTNKQKYQGLFFYS